MPAPTPRLVARVRRDFERSRWDDVLGWLAGFAPEEYGRQDPERIQAALVVASHGDWSGFMSAVRLMRIDWRDLLVAGGLADADWQERLDAELAAPSD